MKRRRRNSEPRGRLLELPLREYAVEAFPRDMHGEWMLHLVVNGRDVKDVVRDPKTGLAKTFATKPAANRWWESHGHAFVNAMGKVACVRTRKANSAGPAARLRRLLDSFRGTAMDDFAATGHLNKLLSYGSSRGVRAELLDELDHLIKGAEEFGTDEQLGQLEDLYQEIATGKAANPATFHKPGPAGGGGRNDADFARDFAREVRGLAGDPSLATPAMRRHLHAMAARPGRGLRRGNKASTREWIEFAGYAPNYTTEIVGVALSGDLPGVRIDVIEAVGAKTGRVVKIAAGQKDLWLVWFKSGERFALTGGPSSMRELARDFQRLGESVYLTKVDYVAPRYPVPVGVKRSKSNRDMSIAYTHDVENKTLLTWNGQTDPRRARFDIRVQGKRRRWVNRSGLTF